MIVRHALARVLAAAEDEGTLLVQANEIGGSPREARAAIDIEYRYELDSNSLAAGARRHARQRVTDEADASLTATAKKQDGARKRPSGQGILIDVLDGFGGGPPPPQTLNDEELDRKPLRAPEGPQGR